MSSIIKLVNDADNKLYTARSKCAHEFETAIEDIWTQHVSSGISATDRLTMDISAAFEERKLSGGKTYIAGYVQSFFRENKKYVPVPELAQLHKLLKKVYRIHENASDAAQSEWESVVTYKVLSEYHYEKNKNRVLIYDDDAY